MSQSTGIVLKTPGSLKKYHFMRKSISSLAESITHLFESGLNIHSLLPVVLLITMLPHLYSTPAIISVFIICMLFWFVLHTLAVISLPGKLLRFILVLIAMTLLVMNFGFIFSQKASLTLLCVMVSLKFLEIKNELDRRNIFLLLFLGYFILVTHFLYSQDIVLSLFSLVNVIVLTLLLSAFNRKPQNAISLSENLRLLVRLFFKALPIALVLFLFFPRIPGPLWSLPNDGQTSKTGLSDKMFPGSVSELMESNEVAFRVDFDGPPPAADKLYWRGPVLTETDGFLWSQGPQTALKNSFASVVQEARNPVSYTITLEPHQQKWLFALEMPDNVDGDTIEGFYLSNDLQLLNPYNINQLTQYRVTSMTEFRLNRVNKKEIQDALLLVGAANPKTRALGQKWRQSHDNDLKIVVTALDYFKNNPFYYTKLPDVMLDNPSDQFLFDKQRGFCEHYASSFVLLMRAANIPARVVTGYQGVEKNDVGDYYIVRQSNAHAWAEVWLSDKGWVRIDPTAVIPASRIEPDIMEANLDRMSFSSLNLPELSQLSAQQKTAIYQFWKQVKQSIDNIKHTWNNWILGYDQSKQNLLLKFMGLTANWKNLVFLLIGGIAALLVLFQLIRLYQSYQQIDRVYRYYAKFIEKLNRAGLSVKLSDGPESVKRQAIRKLPQQQKIIQDIIDSYIQIRYASQNDKQLQKNLIAQIKQF